jgi:hypothetical protein
VGRPVGEGLGVGRPGGDHLEAAAQGGAERRLLRPSSFSGASLYFHTAGDVPSTIDPTILAKDADAFRRSVDTIDALPPGALRAANRHAEQLGAEVNPDSRAPFNATKGTGAENSPLGSGGVGGPAAIPVASCP